MSDQADQTSAMSALRGTARVYDAIAPQSDLTAAGGVEFGATLAAFLWRIFLWWVSLLTLSVEILLRRNFGERYLSRVRVLLAAIILGLSLMPRAILAVIQSNSDPRALVNMVTVGMAYGIFLVAICAHAIGIHSRRKKKIRLHSRYQGDSWAIWSRLPFFDSIGGYLGVQMFVEPLFLMVLAVAAATRPETASLSSWLSSGAFWLFVKSYVQKSALDQKVLDQIDSQIEGEVLHGLVNEWKDTGSQSTRGVVVPHRLKEATSSELLTYASATTRLHPALQQLIHLTPVPPSQPDFGRNEGV